MATSVNARNDVWMDGVTVAGQDLRLQQASATLLGASSSGSTGIATRAGVRPGLGSPLLVSASSGMNITVNAGTAFVQGTASATAGIYTACLDTTATLTVTASDPANPRIDNVIAQVVDNGNATSTTTINIQAGTPASSPVAPTLPSNSLLLATIAVGALAASIVAGNITDKRVFTVASGGILPVRTSADQPPASDTPVYRHRLDVAAGGPVSPLEWSTNGTTWNPFAVPAMVKLGSTTAATSAGFFITVSVSGTGYTGLMCTWSARSSGAAGGAVGVWLNLDSSANYGSQQVEGSGSTASATEARPGTSVVVGYCAGVNDPSNAFSGGSFTIPAAFNASIHKAISGTGSKGTVSGSVASFSGAYGGVWANTAAVTSVTLVQLVGNLITGSTLNVYGLT